MNPLAKIVKPDSQPAYVLLVVILAGFGTMRYRKAGLTIAAVFFVIAAILAMKFVRGLMIDLQVAKIGIRAQGRVVRVEQRELHEEGTTPTRWASRTSNRSTNSMRRPRTATRSRELS